MLSINPSTVPAATMSSWGPALNFTVVRCAARPKRLRRIGNEPCEVFRGYRDHHDRMKPTRREHRPRRPLFASISRKVSPPDFKNQSTTSTIVFSAGNVLCSYYLVKSMPSGLQSAMEAAEYAKH